MVVVGMCVCVHAYRRHFSSLLGFSRFSRHAQCDVCSELKARMRLANDPKAKAEAACLFVEHNNAQQEDRRIYYKIRELSRKGDILCIMQDGSDQEKYRVFRCLRQVKDLEGKGPLPRLKLLGSLAHGYVGMFYFIEEDVTKGSALTIEALMTTIEESAKVAQARGRELPHHLWIQLDNAAGENKKPVCVHSPGEPGAHCRVPDRHACVPETASASLVDGCCLVFDRKCFISIRTRTRQ